VVIVSREHKPQWCHQRIQTAIREIERDVDIPGRTLDTVRCDCLRPEQVPPEVFALSELGERDDRVERLASDPAR
jgi:hypothetical protein